MQPCSELSATVDPQQTWLHLTAPQGLCSRTRTTEAIIVQKLGGRIADISEDSEERRNHVRLVYTTRPETQRGIESLRE
jgi:hypothetical protein